MRTDDAILALFRDYSAATLYEAAGKVGDLPAHIRPVGGDSRIVGLAFTIRCWPGDASAMMRSIDDAKPGDVLVIDAGSEDSTVWGGAATVAAKHRGLAGVVTNGKVRDVDQIRALQFPVFSSGVSIHGAVRNHRGWSSLPIAIGASVINPGDIVVSDSDGVVVVSATTAAETLERAAKRKAHELEADRCLASGTPYREWTGVK